MYLYYYLNEKYVGNVDIEVFLASKNSSYLVVTDEKGGALLGSLEMMYGKQIYKLTPELAYQIKRGIAPRGSGKTPRLPPHVYTTSKVGPVLKWDDRSCALCV